METYRLPLTYIASVLYALIFHQKRSFKADSHLALSGRHSPIIVKGRNHIPKTGPYLILMNHYSRPGFIPYWSAFAIASQLNLESHWLMTSAWTSPNEYWNFIKRRVTRVLFTAVCRVYDFIPMPPMPPDPRESMDRALAVRDLLQLARHAKPLAIGMAPEGRDFPGAVLGQPPTGMGRLLAQLSALIKQTIPVGVYEEDGALHISFGQPLIFTNTNSPSKQELDEIISREVMTAIARLLPIHLRGNYG
jgi:1-acyl-sn-glycerol-3-phosphate acyltransferase